LPRREDGSSGSGSPAGDATDAKRVLGFRRSGDVVYRNDNVHSLYSGRPAIHPDNRHALIVAAGDEYLDARGAGNLDVVSSLRVRLDTNLVLVGSPISEGISRLVFGYTPQSGDSESLLLNDAPVDLPFRMVLDHDRIPDRALARRYVEGCGAVARRNWRIESDHAVYIPELGEDGWLETDYLLLTRLRNFLSAEGFARGHSILTVGGAHGTATRALGLLFRENTVLRAVADVTRSTDGPSFQALFKVSGIDHHPTRGSWAKRVELVGDPILIGDDPQRWQAAISMVSGRVREWTGPET
jgi:hypothetical protein